MSVSYGIQNKNTNDYLEKYIHGDALKNNEVLNERKRRLEKF